MSRLTRFFPRDNAIVFGTGFGLTQLRVFKGEMILTNHVRLSVGGHLG